MDLHLLNRPEAWVVAGLMVLVLMFLMTFLARLYRKAGPQIGRAHV